MSASFDIGRFLVCPGRKLYGFLIRSKVKPGALAEIASIPARHGVTILHLTFSRTLSPEKPITALAFLDFTDSNVSPEVLAEEAEKLDFVEEVKIIEPKVEGFIADTVSNPLMLGENRAIILRDTGYKGLIVRIKERIGSGAEAILYYLGFEAGLEYGKKHREMGEKLGVKDPATIYRDISSSMFNCVGYGIMETVEISKNPPYALIRVYNCFECDLQPVSYTHLTLPTN